MPKEKEESLHILWLTSVPWGFTGVLLRTERKNPDINTLILTGFLERIHVFWSIPLTIIDLL